MNSLLKALLVTATCAPVAGSTHAAPTMKRCLTIGHAPFRVADALDPALRRTAATLPRIP